VAGDGAWMGVRATRGVDEAAVRNSLQALTWWLICNVRRLASDDSALDAMAFADGLVPLRSDVSALLELQDADGRPAAVDDRGILAVVNQCLIGRGETYGVDDVHLVAPPPPQTPLADAGMNTHPQPQPPGGGGVIVKPSPSNPKPAFS
jgi:hypothetical protein